MVILRSFGAFSVFVTLVSRKRSWNKTDQNLCIRDKYLHDVVYIAYLTFKWCKVILRSFIAFLFWHPYISKTAGRRARCTKICGSWVSSTVYRVLLIYGVLRQFCGYSVHFRFLTTLYLENGWSETEMDQNLNLRGTYGYNIYRVLLTVKCLKSG